RLAEDGFPEGAESVLVMLDGNLSFSGLEMDRFEIWWGAYLGSADEIAISGRLADVAEEISKTRAEARVRHGWIMDTYLLRRRPGSLSNLRRNSIGTGLDFSQQCSRSAAGRHLCRQTENRSQIS